MAKLLTVEALNIVYATLKASPVWALLEDKIFKGKKPLDFTGECIVINALPMTGNQHQQCIININVFVPNIENIGNQADKTLPDYARIKELSTPINTLFDEYYSDTHSLIVEQEYILENEGFNEHYNNFRVAFRNVNI